MFWVAMDITAKLVFRTYPKEKFAGVLYILLKKRSLI